MAISSPGIGSKLDVNTIVTQLMDIERRPLTQLNNREISFQAKLSAFGSIRSALSQFQGAMSGLSITSRFEGSSAASSDATVVSASATPRAPAGSYSVEVSALAQNQRLVAAGQATTTASIGTGTLTLRSQAVAQNYRLGGAAQSVFGVDNSLAGATGYFDLGMRDLSALADGFSSITIGHQASGPAPGVLVRRLAMFCDTVRVKSR
jgi:flagellar hook-associated protein 2